MPELWGPGSSGALFVRGPARRFVRRGSVGRALCFRGKAVIWETYGLVRLDGGSGSDAVWGV